MAAGMAQGAVGVENGLASGAAKGLTKHSSPDDRPESERHSQLKVPDQVCSALALTVRGLSRWRRRPAAARMCLFYLTRTFECL
jgi:hypothetical protein